jgi:hypothetical protein
MTFCKRYKEHHAMRIAHTLEACSDCIAFVANGTIPDDYPELPGNIAAQLGTTGMRNLVDASGADESGVCYRDNETSEYRTPDDADRSDWFSRFACECCGSRLGGNRNRLAVLTAD